MPRVVLAAVIVAAACSSSATPSDPVAPRGTVAPAAGVLYRYEGMIIDEKTIGAHLCLGVPTDSIPPRCRGPQVVGIEWNSIPWAYSLEGAIWAEVILIGTYDGLTVHLVERVAPGKRGHAVRLDAPETSCPAPEGGWAAHGAGEGRAGRNEAVAWAATQAGFVSAWVDGSIVPPVLNVAVAGETADTEAGIRQRWDGPLCVAPAAPSSPEAAAVAAELAADPEVAEALGPVEAVAIDPVRGVARALVIVAHEQATAWVDDRYGEGLVELVGILEPFGER